MSEGAGVPARSWPGPARLGSARIFRNKQEQLMELNSSADQEILLIFTFSQLKD